MPKYVPPKEGDVILAYLPGNSQAFLKRIQVYLAAKERLVNLDAYTSATTSTAGR